MGILTTLFGDWTKAYIMGQDLTKQTSNRQLSIRERKCIQTSDDYTPAVSGNWSPVPTKQDAALDQLAASLGTVAAAVGVTYVSNSTDLAAAITAATANEIIVLQDGIYTLTSTLTITQPLTLRANVAAYLTGTAVSGPLVSIQLAAQSATSNVVFKNINFIQAQATYNDININNTTVAQKLAVWFDYCSIEIASSSGKGIAMSHTDATHAIVIRVRGKGSEKLNNVTCAMANAGDMIETVNMRVLYSGSATDAITTSGAIAGSQISIKYSEGQTGHIIKNSGSVTGQEASLIYSWTDDGAGTLAANALTDCVGITAKLVV